MIRLLRRYPVGPRLTFAFSALLLICGALIVASLASMALARRQLDDISLDKRRRSACPMRWWPRRRAWKSACSTTSS
ncbi:hypothetical protein ACFQGW_15235 [Xanthomonas theicola]|uniref:hypothetical protein n=1 Tax=Xanthomonas theicola TaxID=56464 RepID=UPI003622AEA0